MPTTSDPSALFKFWSDGGPYVVVAASFVIFGIIFIRLGLIPLFKVVAPIIVDIRLTAEAGKTGQQMAQETIKQAKELAEVYSRLMERLERMRKFRKTSETEEDGG